MGGWENRAQVGGFSFASVFHSYTNLSNVIAEKFKLIDHPNGPTRKDKP